MPLFHHKSEEEKHSEAEAKQLGTQHQADQAASLESLGRGGLPLAAQRRLAELAADKQHLFTSDLSVAEFLLAREEGLRPITQVMGSCFYHVGYTGLFMRNIYMNSEELRTITAAYDNARNLALGRMRQEAKIVGASAVIGVRLHRAEYEWGSDTIEYTAVGTAVRVEGAPPADEPALTTLSGEDFWKLLQAGYGPVGVAAGNCVFYQVGWDTTNMNSMWSGGWANREISDLTQGVRTARHFAQRNLHSEASLLGAEGVVGVSIEQRQNEHEVEMQNEMKRTDIIFTFLTLGTAIARLKHPRPQAGVKMIKPLSGRGMSRPKSQSQLAEE
jgi:uncharacterized protein YbjQ (UPF0145 family)